jgi:hypothetical protein
MQEVLGPAMSSKFLCCAPNSMALHPAHETCYSDCKQSSLFTGYS